MSEVGSRRRAAEHFVQQWTGRGYEKGETHSFWLSLLQDVLGMREVSTSRIPNTSCSVKFPLSAVLSSALALADLSTW